MIRWLQYTIFHCNITFNTNERWGGPQHVLEITDVGRRVPNQRTINKNVVGLCIEELASNGYIIPDVSCIRVQALHESNPDVTTVSELTALGNEIDVVESKWCSHACICI
jgi:hypothetical protein